jgi:hypothetical protein
MGYASQPDGALRLTRILTEEYNIESPNALLFEFLPKSPRLREGETHLDLAIGYVRQRQGTLSGIEFDPAFS